MNNEPETVQDDPYEIDEVAGVSEGEMAGAADAPDNVKQEFLKDLDAWEKRSDEAMAEAMK